MNLTRYLVMGIFPLPVLVLFCACGSLPKSKSSGDPAPMVEDKQAVADEEDDAALNAKAQAHAHYGASVIHDLNGEGEQALQDLEEAVKLDPENESLVMETTRRMLQARQPERALAVIQQATQANPDSGLFYARMAGIQAQLGKNEEALESGRKAIEKAPDLLVAYQQLCFGYLQAKRETDAIALLDKAAARPSLTAEFLVNLAELYITISVQSSTAREEARGKALAVLDRAEKLHPASLPLRLAMADHLNALGESRRAAPIYLGALKEIPEGSNLRERVHARLGEIYLRNEDHKAAAEQLRAMLKADPTNWLPYYYLGAIAMEDKKPAEAVEVFSKALLLRPDFEQVYYDLANAQISAGKAGDALSTLDQARKKFLGSFLLEYLSGVAFSQQKAYKQARQRYTAAEVIARANEPKRLNEHFYFQAAAACERDGDYAEAEKYFNLCLEQAPDFPEALNYLGYMWVERGVNLEKAREMIEKAVKAEPDNEAFLDSLGWVLFKLNRPQEALAALLKSVSAAKEPDATIFDHLGDVQQALGKREDAVKSWRRSLELEDSEAVRKKVQGTGTP
jgi:tetratricopeptide (TPR) repeat protein